MVLTNAEIRVECTKVHKEVKTKQGTTGGAKVARQRRGKDLHKSVGRQGGNSMLLAVSQQKKEISWLRPQPPNL